MTSITTGLSQGAQNKTRLGILLMVATTFVFALQDGISRHLAGEYNVMMIVMIRYWFFAAFVIALAARHAGGFRAAAATSQPGLQIFRALLLAAEICVMVLGFVALGLVASHAVFAVQRKNWLPLVPGPEFAIDSTPGPVCFSLKFSSANFSP